MAERGRAELLYAVTPAGPALSWPIGEAIGVLDPIMSIEQGIGGERHGHVAVDVEHADVVDTRGSFLVRNSSDGHSHRAKAIPAPVPAGVR